MVFASKMRHMIIDVGPSLSTQVERNVNLISHTLIKHSLLFGIAMIMNQCFFIADLYLGIADAYEDIWFLYIVYSMRSLENVTNILVLWLVLRVNYEKYICLCKPCHKCIGKCCFKNVDTRIMVENPYFELDKVAL